MSDAFVSYSSQDAPIVERIVDELRKRGKSVWLTSENVLPGQQLASSVEKGLELSTTVVAVLSRASRRSSWVSTEIAWALANQKPVIPVLVDKDAEIPSLLHSYQILDMTTSATFERSISQLAEALTAPEKDNHSESVSREGFIKGEEEILALKLEKLKLETDLSYSKMASSFKIAAISALLSAIIAVALTIMIVS